MREPSRGVSLGLRLRDDGDALAVEVDGLTVLAPREDRGVVVRPTELGVEDHLLLPVRPAQGDRIAYDLELGAGARGLRRIDRFLEILDEEGVPRVRMEPPYLTDASGKLVPVEVTVAGCEVDTSPAAPWRRPVVAPGSERCLLELSWGVVSYPVVVDPAWKPTGAMLYPRKHLGVARLESGDVLVAGGNAAPTAELYKAPKEGDASDTGAFAATGGIPGGDLHRGAMAPLPGGGAIYHGGASLDDFFKASCWLYDGGTGTWKAGPLLSPNLAEHTLVTLADGRVLLAGGESDEGTSAVTAIYDPSSGPSGSWTKKSPLLQKRREHATAAAGGFVVVAGGKGSGEALASTEIYDVAKDQWAPGPSLGAPRRKPAATALPDGRVLITGGVLSDQISLKDAQAISPATGKLEKLADMQTYRGGHRAVALADGRVLLVAGSGFVEWLPSAELYDPLAPGSPPGASVSYVTQPRRDHALAWLGGMRALVAGGDRYYNVTDTAEIFRLHPDSTPCAEDEECLSGHCVDGVCCKEPCQGECEACSKALRGTDEPDGVCAARAAGVAPRQVPQPLCTDSTQVNTCGTTGRCSGKARTGAAACQLQKPGVRCSEQTCGAPAFVFSVCDGLGGCNLTQCAPYARCDSPDACATACLLSSDCVPDHHCTAAGACEPRKANGAPCDAADACQSGHCVDGVCCDAACEGLCRACSAGAKGGGQDGVCGPIAAGKPSPGDCNQEAPETCGRTGACDGQGACALHGADTPCGAGDLCEQQATGSAAVFSFRCSGGACVPQLKVACGLYPCAGALTCATSCVNDGGCSPGAYCEGGACLARNPAGQPCASGGECASGVCSEGVCCNTTCEGQCESCVQPGLEGTCVAVVGAPPAGRAACPAGEPGEVCGARRCDGVARETCEGFVGEEQPCAPATCKEGSAALLLPSVCAGNGLCRTPEELPCAPYRCAEGACKTSCDTDTDCASGARCEGERCVLSAGCEDTTTLREADGARRSCAPFRCDEGARACLTRCRSTADCAPGNVCDSEGRCLLPSAPEAPAQGGCSTGGAPRAGALWGALALAALAARRGRRRSLLALLPGVLSCSSPGEAPTGATEPPALRRLDSFLATVPGGAPLAASGLAPGVRLPGGADEVVSVREPRSGLEIAFRLEGAAPAEAREGRGLRVYEGALGEATALLLRPAGDGVEDLVFFDQEATPRGELRYRVELGAGVAGLRLLGGTLEFLDAGGAPRLRMEEPYGLAPGAGRIPVAVGVEGCAVDRDPRAPWGRPPVPPGATTCTVRLAWGLRGGPLLIDPAWQSTGKMSDARALHTATRLLDGRVLVAGGGINFEEGQLLSTELYDATTGTWAKTGDLSVPRSSHGAWLLGSGRVLVGSGSAGSSGTSKLSEIYDPTTGLWTPTGDVPSYRYSQTNGTLPDGRPFFCGGYSPNPDVFYNDAYAYNEATGKWSKLPGTMIYRRRYGQAFSIPGGQILVASGKLNTTGSSEVVTDTTEIYAPALGQWFPGPTMKKARQFPASTLTPGGILFAGGVGAGFPPVLNAVEFYRFEDGQFVELAAMNKARAYGSATWLPQEERALIAGGADAVGTQKSSELVALDGSAPLNAGDMAEERGAHTATLLDSGVVLLAGGGKAALGQLGFPSKNAELFSTLQVGQPCQSPGQCPQIDPKDPGSRHCVDGVCCESACSGPCLACSAAKKGGGADGSCGPLPADTDPDNECPEDPESSCGRTGVCNGQGACQVYPEGTLCARSCEVGTAVEGACKQGSCSLAVTPCGLHACDSEAGVCRSGCSTGAHCSAAAFCDPQTSLCTPKKAVGAPCAAADTCQSGHCVDGVCCSNACAEPCFACAKALQGPGGADGSCLPAQKGAVDPRGVCTDLPCLSRETCDGQGACQSYVEGDACSTPKCVGDGSIGFRVARFACAQGLCALEGPPESCGDFSCREGGCLPACEGPEDCSGKAYCAPDKTCAPRLPLGAPCAGGDQCQSGSCVDGVCCNDACEGPCGTCKAPGQEGLCVPRTGQPLPGRPPCPGASPGAPCQERLCDGLVVASCQGWAGSSRVCHPGACSDGKETSVARCDGKGSCGAPVERPCFPYACGEGACLATCAGDADCAEGNRCQGGSCVVALACEAARGLLRDSTGAVVKECGLYRCEPAEGACLSACASTADCINGALCTSKGTCEPPPRLAPEESGCGCRAAPLPAAPGASLALLLALALLRRRPLSPASPR
jgi:MYXO-CTERM domain-containing protein